MARPKLADDQKMVRLTVTIDPALAKRLTALQQERQQASRFTRVDLSAVCREVLTVGLDTVASERPARKKAGAA